MHTIKINAHPEGCSCGCSQPYSERYVINMPGTDLAPLTYTSWATASAKVDAYRDRPSIGGPGVHGPVHEPR